MQRANCFGRRRRVVCRSVGSRGGIYCYGDVADGRTRREQISSKFLNYVTKFQGRKPNTFHLTQD